MTNLTSVQSCTATSCSYNNDGCTAPGITVGGTGSKATCATYITLDARGGLPVADSNVSACHRLECVYNKDLMCSNSAVAILGDTANCGSYQTR